MSAPDRRAPAGGRARSPLKPFALTATFWLPAMFFLWFTLSSPVAYPVIRAVDWLFAAWMPELVRDVQQQYHHLVVAYEARITAGQWRDAALLVEEQRINVLIYAYGLPLFLGLVAATPMSWARTFAQVGIGIVVLAAAQAFGVASEVLLTLSLGSESAVTAGLAEQGVAEAPLAGAAAGSYVNGVLAAHGLSPNLIALLYQFGYLVVPAVAPVVLWIALNRRFLETLVGWRPAVDGRPAPSRAATNPPDGGRKHDAGAARPGSPVPPPSAPRTE